ncbi:hypothetical protein K435DRAFT_961984 [Dendrothele bispora CBS 962.96]|uniref:F-box domain-containing protein n=1 Tax=Dendrothele bispora (strain CBS 962.96) TaxID=1314807 RepID=A0A4S8MP95_DENBC|nr:hypothetical protein K435DRAFT_961984 [Dendrothele bispora CBS 962.96]
MTCVPTGDADVLKVTDSTPSTALLPQELIDKIIDELWWSRPELKACSMVSHAWRPRAMYHLVSRFVMSVSPSPDINKSRFMRFSSPPPSLAPLVTTMELHCIRRSHRLQDTMPRLHLYPNLRELVLEDIFFSNFSRSEIRKLSKALDRFPLPPLCYLRMEKICFSDCEQFLSFIGMSHFSEVSIVETLQDSSSNIVQMQALTFRHLLCLLHKERVESAGYPGMDIVRVLGKSITDLCMEEKLGEDKPFDFDLDPRLCPSLSRLSWTFHTIDSPRVFDQLKKFASLNNLTDFHLGVKRIDRARLSQLSYHSDTIRDANKSLLAKVDKALAPLSNMPSLQTLTFGMLGAPIWFYPREWLYAEGNAKSLWTTEWPKLESAKSGCLKAPEWYLSLTS